MDLIKNYLYYIVKTCLIYTMYIKNYKVNRILFVEGWSGPTDVPIPREIERESGGIGDRKGSYTHRYGSDEYIG